VAAYLEAFNTGDDKKFGAAHEQHMVPDLVKRQSEADRRRLFQHMRGDLGKLEVQRVVKATDKEIAFTVPTRRGEVATFTFAFEGKAPYRISGIDVDVQGGA
jgi:hypothetical protein